MAPDRPARPSPGLPRRPQVRPAVARRRSDPLRCRLLCCPPPGFGTNACGPGPPAARYQRPDPRPPNCWPARHQPAARSRWHPRPAARAHLPAPGLPASGPAAPGLTAPGLTTPSPPTAPPRPVPLAARRTAARPAWLPRGARGAAARHHGPGQPGQIPAVPLLEDHQVRCSQLTRQLALCSVARSRASGRSLSSGSRAQWASGGRSAPRGSCSYALAGAVLATSAVSASGRIATICPCSVLRLPGRSAAAVIPAPAGPAAASAPRWP